MRRAAILFAVMLVAVLAAAGAALAGGAKEFEADLRGEEETPPVATDARGEAEFEVLDGGLLEYRVEVEDIENAVIAGHIHRAPPGVPGPVILDLDISQTSPTCEARAGEIECEATISLPEGVLEQMQNGNAYVNVHTDAFPAGEVRGQVEPD